MRVKDFNKNILIKNLIKTIFLFLLCNFIYLISNYGLIFLFYIFQDQVLFQNFDNLLFYSFFESLILISLVSYFFQYILSIVTHRIYNYDKEWIFIDFFLNYEKIIKDMLKKNNLKLIFKKKIFS